MNNLPFRQPGGGRLFRGNLHTHSNKSDGCMSPEQVCEAYRQQGYDFIALTDHFEEEFGFPITDTTGSRESGFTTILGAELHAPTLQNGQVWHILACGLPLDFAGRKEGETGPEIAQRALDAGAFVGLAHPAWYGATVEDLQNIPQAHAIEAYNEVCGSLNDKPESWFHIDQLLSSGRRVSAFAAGDAHFRHFAVLPDPVRQAEGSGSPWRGRAAGCASASAAASPSRSARSVATLGAPRRMDVACAARAPRTRARAACAAPRGTDASPVPGARPPRAAGGLDRKSVG